MWSRVTCEQLVRFSALLLQGNVVVHWDTSFGVSRENILVMINGKVEARKVEFTSLSRRYPGYGGRVTVEILHFIHLAKVRHLMLFSYCSERLCMFQSYSLCAHCMSLACRFCTHHACLCCFFVLQTLEVYAWMMSKFSELTSLVKLKDRVCFCVVGAAVNLLWQSRFP